MIRNRIRAFVLSTAFAILGFTVPATASRSTEAGAWSS